MKKIKCKNKFIFILAFSFLCAFNTRAWGEEPDALVLVEEVSLANVGSHPIRVSAPPGQSRVTNRATIRNTGSQNEDFTVRIASTSGPWDPVTGNPGPNQYRLSALWHQFDETPTLSEFASNDVITGTSQRSSGSQFFNERDTHSVVGTSGSEIPPGNERALFFRFDAPSEGFGSAIAHVQITAIPALSEQDIVISTGGVMDAGNTTIEADAGVQIGTEVMDNGTTQQVLVSPIAASVSYGNGFSLSLPPGIETSVVASPNAIEIRSTETVAITNRSVDINASGGFLFLRQTFDSLAITLSTNTEHRINLNVLPTNTRTIAVTLNPPSGQVSVTIPPGAVDEEIGFSIHQLNAGASPSSRFVNPQNRTFAAPSSIQLTPIGIEISLSRSVRLNRPIVFRMKYRDEDLNGADVSTLKVARFEETSQSWIFLPTTVDTLSKTVIAESLHLSVFQLLSLRPATNVEGVIAFPNPLEIHRGFTTMNFQNVTAGAQIKIYTYLGELVQTLVADASGIVTWDARSRFGELVASGVYLAMVEDANGSEKLIKIAVEK